MKVKFIDVGREHANWEAKCPGELTYEWLLGQVRPQLVSSDIWFTEDSIHAGFHTVGRLEIGG